MEPTERTEIERICRELIVAVTHYSDHGDVEPALDLFTETATWLRANTLYSGLDEIRQSYRAFPPSQVARHLIGIPFVTVTDHDHASSVTYYTAYVRDPGTLNPAFPLEFDGPFTMGEWHDSFVRTDLGWRFSSRASLRLFQNGPLR